MPLSKRLRIVLMIAVISLALVFLDKFKMPLNTFFWRSVFDFGHIPLFGVISIALLGISQTFSAKRYSNPLIHYALALFITGFLGFVTELLQYFTPRDADFFDIVHDVIGAVCFLGFYLTIDRRVSSTRIALSDKLKYFIRLFVFLLGLAMITPTVKWIGAYTNRDISFPEICTFELPWEYKFISAANSLTAIVPAPFGSENVEINHSGKMLLNSAGYSGFLIEEPYPDWTEYETLTFTVFSEHAENINLKIKINKIFNQSLLIVPGLNKIEIPVNEIKNRSGLQLLNIQKIGSILLFTEQSMDSLAVYLDDFKLE